MLFENLPFTLLLFSMKLKFLRCHELTEGKSTATINISLVSTGLQVFLTVMMTWIESKWLKESALSYLMTKLTANNKWIPYVHKITKRDCDFNINFGELAIQIPFVSHAFGFYSKTHFEFSDVTLQYMLNELKLWSSELAGQPKKQKYTITMTQDCLNQVTSNFFIHFVHSFPEDVFILDIKLDWRSFHEKQERDGLMIYKEQDGEKRSFSPIGVPLVILCIQNEQTTNGKWPLQEMLKIIIESGHYEVNDKVNGSPLSVALQNYCFESIQILNSSKSEFDYQMQDQAGISMLGHMVTKFEKAEKDSKHYE